MNDIECRLTVSFRHRGEVEDRGRECVHRHTIQQGHLSQMNQLHRAITGRLNTQQPIATTIRRTPQGEAMM